jgi:thiamine-monophosphate kinase
MPLRERALIDRIRRNAVRGRGVMTGIGDDSAVLAIPEGHQALVTTDFSLEGVHFRREWHPPDSVGHRCLARGFSDIAAMGGTPITAFLSLALPQNLPQKWVDGFMRGLFGLAEKFGVSLAGGDTAESPAGVLADIIVLGSVPKGKAVLRSGARPGDRIYVTGALGGSAAIVKLLLDEKRRRRIRPRDFPQHFYPIPRLEVGRFLRENNLASAMIDISDGLSTDLAHICEENGVGAEILEQLIPKALIGRPAPKVDLRLAIHGGEDYELLFTAAQRTRIPSRIAGIAITEIGEIKRTKNIMMINQHGMQSELRPEGWEHFNIR